MKDDLVPLTIKTPKLITCLPFRKKTFKQTSLLKPAEMHTICTYKQTRFLPKETYNNSNTKERNAKKITQNKYQKYLCHSIVVATLCKTTTFKKCTAQHTMAPVSHSRNPLNRLWLKDCQISSSAALELQIKERFQRIWVTFRIKSIANFMDLVCFCLVFFFTLIIIYVFYIEIYWYGLE